MVLAVRVYNKARPNEEDTVVDNKSTAKDKIKKNWAVILILLIIAILSIVMISEGGFGRNTSDLEFGSIDWEEPEDLQQKVNDAVAAGMVNVFMNTNVYLDDGGSEANLLIQNSEHNPGPIQVDIRTVDTDELLYSSEVIPVGYKIENAPLLIDLDAGTYDCMATFTVLDPDDEDREINKVNLAVQVTVKK